MKLNEFEKTPIMNKIIKKYLKTSQHLDLNSKIKGALEIIDKELQCNEELQKEIARKIAYEEVVNHLYQKLFK
ncbi:MAG: hypothetical protein LBD41_04985 [Clostridiales Family XIII bacterium]|jgi:hypothetical protein|nr:hypothetical protein [Clostridiales Family XIII bacterium]